MAAVVTAFIAYDPCSARVAPNLARVQPLRAAGPVSIGTPDEATRAFLIPPSTRVARGLTARMELLEIYFLACLAMFFPLLLIVVVLALNTSHPVPILAGFLAGGLVTTVCVGSAIVFAFQGRSFVSPAGRPPTGGSI